MLFQIWRVKKVSSRMLLVKFTRRISLAEVTHWARSDTAALRTSRRQGLGLNEPAFPAVHN